MKKYSLLVIDDQNANALVEVDCFANSAMSALEQFKAEIFAELTSDVNKTVTITNEDGHKTMIHIQVNLTEDKAISQYENYMMSVLGDRI